MTPISQKTPALAEAELQKLATPETAFDTKKQEVIAQTQGTLTRFGQVMGLTAALALTTPVMADNKSPYEPIADGSRNFPLVLKESENPKTQSDLFEAFDRNNKSEKRDIFAKLSQDQQKKVLAYYKNAKAEQPNEKAVLKGVYNLMSYYINLKINEDALVQYKQTGKLPDTELPAIAIHASMVAQGFSNGFQYAEVEKARRFDNLIIDLLKKETADLKKETADWKKRVENLQKNVDMLETLLKAL